jgi:hypothetical protein
MSLLLIGQFDVIAGDSNANPNRFFYYDDSSQEFVLVSADNQTELERIGGGNAKTTTFFPVIVSPDFTTPPFVAMIVGQRVATPSYKASPFGAVFEKVSLAGGDLSDWRVISTNEPAPSATTGAIALPPAP